MVLGLGYLRAAPRPVHDEKTGDGRDTFLAPTPTRMLCPLENDSVE